MKAIAIKETVKLSWNGVCGVVIDNGLFTKGTKEAEGRLMNWVKSISEISPRQYKNVLFDLAEEILDYSDTEMTVNDIAKELARACDRSFA